jgi:hypothetical protein
MARFVHKHIEACNIGGRRSAHRRFLFVSRIEGFCLFSERQPVFLCLCAYYRQAGNMKNIYICICKVTISLFECC